MSESKYGKYFLTEDLMPPMPEAMMQAMERPGQRRQDPRQDDAPGHDEHHSARMLAVRGVRDPLGASRRQPVDIEIAHSHDFDEVIGFGGTNRNYPRELGGEIEFLMGGERHTITKTCLMFVPKGVEHCPITLKRIDTPIFMFEATNDPDYKKLF